MKGRGIIDAKFEKKDAFPSEIGLAIRAQVVL
jgi:hypothetical protein